MFVNIVILPTSIVYLKSPALNKPKETFIKTFYVDFFNKCY